MAVTTESGLLSMLKVFYAKEGLMNLLFRNDEFLKTIKKQRVEGKTQNFSALYTRGGAVSATWTKAKALATQTAQAKEFAIEPGQLFSAAVFRSGTYRGGVGAARCWLRERHGTDRNWQCDWEADFPLVLGLGRVRAESDSGADSSRLGCCSCSWSQGRAKARAGRQASP